MSTEEQTSLADDIGEIYDTLSEDEVEETQTDDVEEKTEEQEAASDKVIVIEASEEGEGEEAEEEIVEAAAEDEETVEAAAEDDEEDEIEPLAHWLKDDKEEFKGLPATAKEFLVRRDKEFQRQATEKVNEVMHIKRALEPIRDELNKFGLSDDQAVRTLVSAHLTLQDNPKQGIQALMARYNLTAEALLSSDDSQGTTDPRVEALENKVTEYERFMMARDQAQLAGRLEEFKKNAEFYEDVLDEMIELAAVERMRNPGSTPDIDAVYEKACRMNDKVRTELARREAAGESKAKSTIRSKNAAGVKVKKTPVAKKRVDETKPKSLHEDIAASWDEVEEREHGTAL